MKKIILLVCISCSMLFASACTDSTNQTTYQCITQEEAKQQMDTTTDYVILDVRTEEEYQEGHIPNAICIPNETIDETIKEQLPDLDQPIYVYCRSGNRSKQASQKLAELGYTHIFEFGGIQTWEYEIEKSE